MYKYVDEKGQVHYTNVPPQNAPPSGKVEKIEPKGGVSILGTEYEDPEPSGKLNSIIDGFKTKLKKIKEPEQKHEQKVELYSTTW